MWWCPDERDEAIRDLSRTREDAVSARLKARQRVKAMLLRHGRRYSGKSSWTLAHERYLADVKFAHPAQHIAFTEYRQAVKEGQERVERLTEALRAQSEQWRRKPVVEALSESARHRLRGRRDVGRRDRGFQPVFPPTRTDGLSGAGALGVSPPARLAVRVKSPSVATFTRGACWWRRHGITAFRRASVAFCRSARRVNPKPCATSPGEHSCASRTAIGT